ncbi:MAG TPA: hypothetical protein GXX20_03185 [Clostridiaceae bacterium]|nr:hypothetical protein [Clostridiaceae bacterium]
MIVFWNNQPICQSIIPKLALKKRSVRVPLKRTNYYATLTVKYTVKKYGLTELCGVMGRRVYEKNIDVNNRTVFVGFSIRLQ